MITSGVKSPGHWVSMGRPGTQLADGRRAPRELMLEPSPDSQAERSRAGMARSWQRGPRRRKGTEEAGGRWEMRVLRGWARGGVRPEAGEPTHHGL